jgi:5-methylcytosine-specific restriction protein A
VDELEAGRVYRRRELHDRFKGQRQGGISTPADRSEIFLFTGSSGASYGYEDFEDDAGVLHYFGEGQRGDMQFTGGNKAIRDHALAGKELLLFEQERRGFVRYLGRRVCAGFEWKDGVPDVDLASRRAIVFQLVSEDSLTTPADPGLGEEESLEALRAAASEGPAESGTSKVSKRKVYRRSAALRRYVLARAKGGCEGCGQPAPFSTAEGSPFLEPHHVRRLSDGGPDHPAWVIALCPNCHARVHHGGDGVTYNETLKEKLTELEP